MVLAASYYVARYSGGEFWLHLFLVLVAGEVVNLFLYLKDWREQAECLTDSAPGNADGSNDPT